MSFPRHPEIYPSDEGAAAHGRAPAHRADEFPAGYSLAGCSPAAPASASPAGFEYPLQMSCRSSSFQRTANCVLTVCLSPGGKGKPRPQCLSADLGEPELCVPGMGGSGSPGGIRTVKASADRILQKLGTIREHSALEIGPKRPKWSQRDTFTSYFKSAISVASKPLRRVGTRPCKGRRQRFKYIPGHHIFHN